MEINKNTVSISGIPPECQEENLQFIIENLLEQQKNENELTTNKNSSLAISLALSLSISNTKTLSEEEMSTLINELKKCDNPNICPIGKPIMINLKTSDIEKHF